jgi:membrane protein XagC
VTDAAVSAVAAPRSKAFRALGIAPLGLSTFLVILALAAFAVRLGLVGDDTLRLWAGASTAADGDVPIGRIVAAYPTLPFTITTLVAWIAPADAPAPALVAAALLSVFAVSCFLLFRKAGLPLAAAGAVTTLIVLHPALLRAVVAGPGDMFLAVFLLMLCLGLYDLRARSDTSEVMRVGLALMALAFSHPMGAAIAFAIIPFLAFVVRPSLVANSAFNVTIALVFPTFFAIAAFSYVAWVFPGDGWTFFAAPSQSLALWTAAVERLIGDRLFAIPALEAGVAMALALAIAAPAVVVILIMVRRRRPLVVPAAVFIGAVLAATALSVLSGLFGDPAAMVVAAPALTAAVVARVPAARERLTLLITLLMLGWLGGFWSLALADPVTLSGLRANFPPSANSARMEALAAGGASAGHDGVLVDLGNSPAFVLGRGGAAGLLGPQSEAFALTLMFARIETPFVAVPDPLSAAGAGDALDKAFPLLFSDGLPGYHVIYQNNTWRVFERINNGTVHRR